MYSFNNKVLSFYSLPGRMIPLLSGRVQFIRGGKSLNYKSLNRFSASGTWVSFRVVLKGNQELVSSCSPLPPIASNLCQGRYHMGFSYCAPQCLEQSRHPVDIG